MGIFASNNPPLRLSKRRTRHCHTPLRRVPRPDSPQGRPPTEREENCQLHSIRSTRSDPPQTIDQNQTRLSFLRQERPVETRICGGVRAHALPSPCVYIRRETEPIASSLLQRAADSNNSQRADDRTRNENVLAAQPPEDRPACTRPIPAGQTLKSCGQKSCAQ